MTTETIKAFNQTDYYRGDSLIARVVRVGLQWQFQGVKGEALAPLRHVRATAESDALFFFNRLNIITNTVDPNEDTTGSIIDPDQIDAAANKLLDKRGKPK